MPMAKGTKTPNYTKSIYQIYSESFGQTAQRVKLKYCITDDGHPSFYFMICPNIIIILIQTDYLNAVIQGQGGNADTVFFGSFQ